MAPNETKPLLIFVNPASGTKIARKLFSKSLKPDLEQNELEYEHVETKYAGYAAELVQQKDLSNIGGVITISGDGLVHEVLNGIYCLPNWEHILKTTPIGVMPGGSGNALNCSLLRQLNQPHQDGRYKLGEEYSSKNICNGAKSGKKIGFDLIEVETPEKRCISFLGVTIGIVADVDIGSEIIRFLGFMRSYLLVAYKILVPRVYHAKVSYLPLGKDESGKFIPVKPTDPKIYLPPLDHPVPSDWVSEHGRYLLVYALNLCFLDPVNLLAPKSRVDDGVIWLVMVRSSMQRKDIVDWLMNMKTGGHVNKPGVEMIPVRAFRIEPIRPPGYLSIDGESFKFGPVQGQMLAKRARLFCAT